jgi:hypothetical protein
MTYVFLTGYIYCTYGTRCNPKGHALAICGCSCARTRVAVCGCMLQGHGTCLYQTLVSFHILYDSCVLPQRSSPEPTSSSLNNLQVRKPTIPTMMSNGVFLRSSALIYKHCLLLRRSLHEPQSLPRYSLGRYPDLGYHVPIALRLQWFQAGC